MTINQGCRRVPAHQCSCLALCGGSQFTPVLSGVSVTSALGWHSSAWGTLSTWAGERQDLAGMWPCPSPRASPALKLWWGTQTIPKLVSHLQHHPQELQDPPRDQATVIRSQEFEVKTSCTAKKKKKSPSIKSNRFRNRHTSQRNLGLGETK